MANPTSLETLTPLERLTQFNNIPHTLICDADEEEFKPGIYLELYHGRHDPDQDMDDWGFSCPHLLGPFESVIHTYFCQMRLFSTKLDVDIDLGSAVSTADLSGLPANVLCRYDDMLHFQGAFYGDWAFISK